MDLTLLQKIFLTFTILLTLFGLILRLGEKYIPVPIRNLYRYGKTTAKGGDSIIPSIQVPKRWFRHYYIYAAPTLTYTLFIALRCYLGFGNVPEFIHPILDFFFGGYRKPLVSMEHTTLAIIMMLTHISKRLYEVNYVSVFSDVTMNLGHYILGLLHYSGLILSLIGESEGFVRGYDISRKWNINRLTYIDYIATVMLIYATYKQYTCNIILANLRKNSKGKVVTLEHKIPRGGLFEYVSSPLQTTEIIVYFMLTIILWSSKTYHMISFWVLMNQIGCGLLGHWWYQENFEHYPKHKKGVIPWIL